MAASNQSGRAERLASGTHKTTSGFKMPSKYPRAEDRVMRFLGHQVEDIAGIAADAEAVRGAERYPRL